MVILKLIGEDDISIKALSILFKWWGHEEVRVDIAGTASRYRETPK